MMTKQSQLSWFLLGAGAASTVFAGYLFLTNSFPPEARWYEGSEGFSLPTKLTNQVLAVTDACSELKGTEFRQDCIELGLKVLHRSPDMTPRETTEAMRAIVEIAPMDDEAAATTPAKIKSEVNSLARAVDALRTGGGSPNILYLQPDDYLVRLQSQPFGHLETLGPCTALYNGPARQVEEYLDVLHQQRTSRYALTTADISEIGELREGLSQTIICQAIETGENISADIAK